MLLVVIPRAHAKRLFHLLPSVAARPAARGAVAAAGQSIEAAPRYPAASMRYDDNMGSHLFPHKSELWFAR
jgi:hypothetical protein